MQEIIEQIIAKWEANQHRANSFQLAQLGALKKLYSYYLENKTKEEMREEHEPTTEEQD